MAQHQSFEGKVVWVTGASSGIGKSLAEKLANEGAKLILSARRQNLLEELRDGLPDSSNAAVLPLDLANLDELDAAAAEAWDMFGAIDIMVHNGGVGYYSRFEDSSFSTQRYLMDVDYFSYVKLTQELLPRMKKRKSGHFVVVSSLAGKITSTNATAYCAAKHALLGFFNCLRHEVRADGIAVTVVCPGFVRTPIDYAVLDGRGIALGQPMDSIQNGMDLDECTSRMLVAIRKQLSEVEVVNINTAEWLGARLQALSPRLFHWVISRSPIVED